MQHRPRGLIRTQLHLSLHLRCRYADLVAHHAPRGREPDRQRRTRLVKDRARRRRHLPLTTATLPAAIRQTPSRGTRAVRTYESVGPSQPIQVVQTLPVLIEPRPHLRVRSRVITPSITPETHLTRVPRWRAPQHNYVRSPPSFQVTPQ